LEVVHIIPEQSISLALLLAGGLEVGWVEILAKTFRFDTDEKFTSSNKYGARNKSQRLQYLKAVTGYIKPHSQLYLYHRK
jgi:hypothetical protein